LVLLDVGDDDIIVARVTSQAWQGTFDVDLKGWKDAGLLLPSIVRLHKVVTLEKRLVRRTLGHLSKEDWAVVKAKLQTLWMFS
jgi:mRNA interferase MazF